MKKNISINISGIIFHVEEDGYELLKNYLESISRYFSTYEDSKEITDDIESRIAEIFLAKLSNSKQVITREDVEGVIKTMGNVEDFAAAEGMEEETGYRTYTSSDSTYQEAEDETYGRKRLYRDTERKVLGGVAAGIAHYFKTDPLWIRLALLIFFFADAFASFGTITLVSYIVLWIVLPGNATLVQNEKIKKFFRNPDDKVIGGVSGGIAAYFGTDPTVIRLLFVLSIFLGGTGFFIYVILWIITPEAKSLTDKMQMKGEPVTLTNIESSIKKNFSVDANGEESLLLKIILFPFRLIAIVINALGRALGPILSTVGDLARVLLGLLLILLGGGFVFGLLVSGGLLLGLSSFDPVIDGDIPLRLLRESIPATASVFAFLAILIPALALIISGVAVILKRKLLSSTVSWSAFGLWFVALIGLSVTVPQVVMDFREEGRITSNEPINLNGATALLTLGDYPESNDYARPRLMIRAHEDSVIELEKEFEAKGRNRKSAIEYAQMISYEVGIQDSTISFPPVFTFEEGAKFRDQEVDLTLYLPYQYPFMMDRELSLILRNSLYREGYSISDLRDNTFIFTEDGLECLSCEKREEMDDLMDNLPDSTQQGAYSKDFEVGDFQVLNIAGPFRVEIRQGDYQLEMSGDENRIEDVDVASRNNSLELKYGNSFSNQNEERISVTLTVPDISAIRLNANAQINVNDFELDDLTLDLAGSSEAFVKTNAQTISLNMRGASGLKLFGEIQKVDATLSGAAKLDALETQIEDASVESSGAAKIRLQVNGELNADPEDSSKIEYSGNPRLNISSGNENKVTRIE